ncbi:MAG: FumA C-terminus/TtdB family hydratase beta subunit [Candidatus Omnitrophota bacterium]
MEKLLKIKAPLDGEALCKLKAGDTVKLSGVIYTARDQAHLRMYNMIMKGEPLPVELKAQIIYYCGPSPRGERIIGSCGPTTSGRMDAFSPALMTKGLKGMIGKGKRSAEVKEAIKKYRAVYFLAPGGAGAYLSERVRSCTAAAFEDLGPEAVYRLEVEDFPLIVGVDCLGNDIYDRLNAG